MLPPSAFPEPKTIESKNDQNEYSPWEVCDFDSPALRICDVVLDASLNYALEGFVYLIGPSIDYLWHYIVGLSCHMSSFIITFVLPCCSQTR
jgi:hypothetical protein